MEMKTIVFRVNDGQGPELLYQVFLERGWIDYDEETQDEYDWNIWWRSSRFRLCDYENLMPWQRLNHCPKSTGITRKDCLARNLKRMRGIYGAGVFNFTPIAFNLPNDYTKYVAEYSKLKQTSDSKNLLWICKPADLSRGRGIFIFRDLADLQYDCSAVVQRYIPNPHLISGYKFDVRIYVAVPSFHPLSVYIYQEGIVRFSTEKYNLGNTGNIFAHLTNTSINKHSPNYSTDKAGVGPGCKWTLGQLRCYFQQSNVNDSKLWKRIINIVILTLLTQAPMVTKMDNCFELYGFDILVDDNLKPWLLEVNFSPSLSSDCHADVIVKKPLLHDLMDMMNFKSADMERGGDGFKKQSPHKSYSNLDHSFSMGRLGRSNSDKNFRSVVPGNVKCDAELGNDYGGSTNFLCMADGDDSEHKPIFGLPLVQHSDDEGCPSDRSTDNGDDHKSSTARKGKSDTMLSERYSNVSHEMTPRSRDRTQESARSMTSDRASGRRSGYKLRKVHSKGSSLSDSGISSYSGSSENSDITQRHGGTNVPTVVTPSLASSDKVQNESTAGDRVTRKANPISRKALIKKSSYQSHFKKSSPFKIVSQLTTVTRVGHNAFIGTVNNFGTGETEQVDDLSTSPTPSKYSVRAKKSQISVSDIRRIYKSVSVSKSSVHSSDSSQASQFAGSKKTDQRTGKNHFGIPKPAVPKGPKARIGDFFLVFPFNEMTRRASLASLDARVIIRECQKLLKDSSGKTGGDPSDGDVPRLWSPMKVMDGS